MQWGLGNKMRSAAECCRACKEFKPRPDNPDGCNIWVYCGEGSFRAASWCSDSGHEGQGPRFQGTAACSFTFRALLLVTGILP